MRQWSLACALAVLALHAQERSPVFEVASIRPADPNAPELAATGRRTGGGCPFVFKLDRGRADIRCATVAMLIGYAFRISPDRVEGPDWMMRPGSARFDIAATLPSGSSTNQVPEMLQALLVDRFKLASHRGNKGHQVYVLVVRKGGPTLKPAAQSAGPPPDSDSPSTMSVYGETQSSAGGRITTISNPRMGTVRQTDGPGRTQRWEALSTTLEGLADLLDRVAPFSSPVVDGTKLKGRYQVDFKVTLPGLPPDPGSVDDARTEIDAASLRAFNDGLRSLGLELRRGRAPVETIVIDHVERTPSAN